MSNRNYYFENSVNLNRNMVVLEILEKFLKDSKPKLEFLKHNPYMNIQCDKVMSTEVTWFWSKITFKITYYIKRIILITANLHFRLTGTNRLNNFHKCMN